MIAKDKDQWHQMEVHLTYFKDTGKYYSDGVCYVNSELHLFQIWDELRELFKRGIRPGLVNGHSDFHVLIDVPNHINNHPRLMLSVA